MPSTKRGHQELSLLVSKRALDLLHQVGKEAGFESGRLRPWTHSDTDNWLYKTGYVVDVGGEINLPSGTKLLPCLSYAWWHSALQIAVQGDLLACELQREFFATWGWLQITVTLDTPAAAQRCMMNSRCDAELDTAVICALG